MSHLFNISWHQTIYSSINNMLCVLINQHRTRLSVSASFKTHCTKIVICLLQLFQILGDGEFFVNVNRVSSAQNLFSLKNI
jgi:hypothetical protein